MHKRVYLLVLCLGILWGCNEDTVFDAEYYRPIYSVAQAFAQLEDDLFDYSEAGFANLEALARAAADLENADPNVTDVEIFDSAYVYITMSSGLEVIYALFPTDEAGNQLYRGGGSNSGSSFAQLTDDCNNEISNKKILLFNADFGTTLDARSILNDKKEEYELEITELWKEECTYESLSTFQDYGLVVLNTHGLPNGFLLGEKLPVSIQDQTQSLEDFAEQINLSDPDQTITDLIMFDLSINIIGQKDYVINVPIYQQGFQDADDIGTYVSAKQIAKLNLSNTIVFGNMCYSGWSSTVNVAITDLPILTAFEQTGVRTYYGYQQMSGTSRAVNSSFAEAMEERLYNGFFMDEDHTGNVHLDMNDEEYFDPVWASLNDNNIQWFGQLYCRQFFADDYCYKLECPDSIVDDRDGTVYQTVCIGDQVWMAENLNYTSSGVCYNNSVQNCDEHGRLYNIAELSNYNYSNPTTTVRGVCPDGFHIPSYDEYAELFDFCGGESQALEKLLSTDGWSTPSNSTDEFGFNLKPSGRGVLTFIDGSVQAEFQGLEVVAALWTSSQDTSSGHPVHLVFSPVGGIGYVAFDPDSNPLAEDGWKASCRCVKDED